MYGFLGKSVAKIVDLVAAAHACKRKDCNRGVSLFCMTGLGRSLRGHRFRFRRKWCKQSVNHGVRSLIAQPGVLRQSAIYCTRYFKRSSGLQFANVARMLVKNLVNCFSESSALKWQLPSQHLV